MILAKHDWKGWTHMDEAKLCPTCGSLLSSGQVKKVLHQMHIDAEAAERKAKIDAEKKFGDALAMVERAKKAAEERSTRAEAETSRLKKNQERKDEATKQAAERKAKVDAETKFVGYVIKRLSSAGLVL